MDEWEREELGCVISLYVVFLLIAIVIFLALFTDVYAS